MALPNPRRSPNLGTVLDNAILSRLLDVHTAIPAKVETYNPATQTVNVKPTIKPYALRQGKPVAEEIAVINNVPLVFPGAGGFRLTFPVQPGDVVLLVFSEASLDIWQSSSGAQDVDPKDHRRHHLSDAIAIPGLHTNTKPWTGAAARGMTLGKDGGPQVLTTEVGVELGASDASPAVSPVLKGDVENAAINAFVASLIATLTAAFVGPPGSPIPPATPVTAGQMAAVTAAIVTAAGTLATSLTSALSPIVKTK